MTKNDIMAELTDLMRDYFDDDSLILTLETTAKDVPEWDSMAHVNIVVGVESHFGVRFSISEVEKLKSVGDLVELIAEKKGV